MRILKRVLIGIPTVMLVLWTVAPFVVSFAVSLKTRGEVFANPSLLPRDPSFQAYLDVLARPGFRTALFNSVLIGFGSTVLTLVLAVPAAYAFVRFRFRGRHLLLLFVLLPRLVPGVGIMVPLYRLAATFGVWTRATR